MSDYCSPSIALGRVPVECYPCFRCFYLIRRDFDKANEVSGHTDTPWNYCKRSIGLCVIPFSMMLRTLLTERCARGIA